MFGFLKIWREKAKVFILVGQICLVFNFLIYYSLPKILEKVNIFEFFLRIALTSVLFKNLRALCFYAVNVVKLLFTIPPRNNSYKQDFIHFSVHAVFEHMIRKDGKSRYL